MKFLQLTATREGTPKAVWVNPAQIARMSANENGGTAVYFAVIDDKGHLVRMNVQETPEAIMAAAAG